MFAARFDPNAIIEDSNEVSNTVKALPLKRKREVQVESEDETSEDEEETTKHKEDEDEEMKDLDSSSESSESSSSDSGSESESDSDSESESENESDGKEQEQHQDTEPIIQDHDGKHSSVFSRFTKSIKKSKQLEGQQSDSDSEEEQTLEKHDLAPLPQPDLPKDKKLSRQLKSKNLNWLSEPLYISPKDLKPFDEFDQLNPKIRANLKSLGFENAFASQIKTLELLLPEISNSLNPLSTKGDVLVNASTGSGKTLAYSIPIVQSLIGRVVPRLRAVIIVPTKPLIQQVYKTLISISKGFDLNIVTLGGGNASINEEREKFSKNVPDILITTPGRFVEHLNLKSLDLKNLNFLIIDEADRLLNQSFQDWLNVLFLKLNELSKDSVLKNFHKGLIKMIFSATLTTDSGKLTNLKFNNPRLIIVNDEDSILTNDKIFTLPLNLTEHQLVFPSNSNSLKPLLLLNLLFNLKDSNALIFTKSNESTLRLTRLLKILVKNFNLDKDITETSISSIHSELSNSAKANILKDFSSNESIKFLISTDLISRGIDISSIRNVINYDLPNSSREFVHRVGRTARAGNSGDAYSFVIGKGEEKFWKSLSLDINRSEEIHDYKEITNDSTKEKFNLEVYQESLKELEKQVFNSK